MREQGNRHQDHPGLRLFEIGGHEGVTLDERLLIADGGPIALSRYPFEDNLLSTRTAEE
ncbi:MAG: hypothetical protein RIC87_23770 [Kiloniellales bacterium]